MGWLDYSFSSKKVEDSWAATMSNHVSTMERLLLPSPLLSYYYSEDPQEQQHLMLLLVCTGCFTLGVAVGRMRPLSRWQRVSSLQDLSSSQIGGSTGKSPSTAPFFRGRAVTVSDGDTLRFLHVPTYFHSTSVPKGENVSKHTWAIRVCTIDTPETAKFGNPGQPFGEEAKERLATLVLHDKTTIHIQLLTVDQYGRGVAQVRTGLCWPFYKYADQVLLEDGLAEVYRGSGAVYGSKGKEYYEALEHKAQKGKKGMWSLGNKRESAAEYKARLKK
jgi:micrococcal nuclease